MIFTSSRVSPTELYSKYRTFALAFVLGGIVLFLGSYFVPTFPNADVAARESFLFLALGLSGYVSTLTAEHFGHVRPSTKRDSRTIALATIRGLLVAVVIFAVGSALNVLSATTLFEYTLTDSMLHPLLAGLLLFGIGVPLLVVARTELTPS